MDKPEFILLFRAITDNSEMTHTDSVVFGFIYWMTKLKNEKCYASNETLADLTGFPLSTVRNSLTKLEKFHFIRRLYDEVNTTKREEIQPLMGFSSIMGAGLPAGGVLASQQGGAGLPAVSIKKSIKEYSSNSEELQIVKEIPTEIKKKADTTYVAVFELWGKYPLNWKANRTEIQAAKNLLEEHGLEACKNALDFYKKHKGEEMCPQILKPSDLDRKYENLLVYFKKV